MKTTTKAGKNQKISRKVQESVEAIQIINFSLKTLSLIHSKSSPSHCEL